MWHLGSLCWLSPGHSLCDGRMSLLKDFSGDFVLGPFVAITSLG